MRHPTDRDRIKRQIADGTYETPFRLTIAFERAMAAIVGPADVDGSPLLRLGQGDFTRDVHEHELLSPSRGCRSERGTPAREGGSP